MFFSLSVEMDNKVQEIHFALIAIGMGQHSLFCQKCVSFFIQFFSSTVYDGCEDFDTIIAIFTFIALGLNSLSLKIRSS